MIKKILVFTTIILYSFFVHAQKKIDKETYDKLVDYANCQYIMAFIDKHDSRTEYYKNPYLKTIKPVLRNASLKNLSSVPSIDKIIELFPNKSNNFALNLAKKIDEKKNKYNEAIDDSALLVILKSDVWENVNLSEVSNNIQDSVKKKFSIQQSKIINNSLKVSFQYPISDIINEINDKINTKLSISIFWIIIFILVVVFLIVGYLLIRLWNRYNKLKINILKMQSELTKTNKKENTINQNDSLKQQPNLLIEEKDINVIVDIVVPRVLECIRLEMEETESKSKSQLNINSSHQINNAQIDDRSFYFASKNGKQLIDQIPNSTNANFKVYSIVGSEGKFQYIGPVRNENWFEEVFIIENSLNEKLSDKKQVNTIQPGKVRKENESWVVTEPAKIKFI